MSDKIDVTLAMLAFTTIVSSIVGLVCYAKGRDSMRHDIEKMIEKNNKNKENTGD